MANKPAAAVALSTPVVRYVNMWMDGAGALKLGGTCYGTYSDAEGGSNDTCLRVCIVKITTKVEVV